MIDEILCRRAKDDFNGPYSPDEALVGREYLNQEARKLAVIFPPWHGGDMVMRALSKRLARKGAVINYQFHDRILEPNIEQVQQSFNVLATKIALDLFEADQKFEYEDINLIGLSLGNVALAKTARIFDRFTRATMVTSASSLADSMWDGARTQNIRQDLEIQGVKMEELSDAWHDLAPNSHAKAFVNKPTTVHISTNDSIIPTRYQNEHASHLSRYAQEVKPAYSSLGHVATLTRFCIKG